MNDLFQAIIPWISYVTIKLAINSEQGGNYSSALTLNYLGELYYEKGDYPAALAFFEQSLALLDQLGEIQNPAVVLLNLGSVAVELKNFDRAAALLRESLTMLNELGDKFHITEALEGLALLAWETGQVIRAAALYGAAEALCVQIDAPLPPRRSRPNPLLAKAEPENTGKEQAQNLESGERRPVKPDTPGWQIHWQAGSKLSLAEMIELALR